MKNMNMAFQLDGETTDDELIARYRLDPRHSGKDTINEAIRQAVMLENQVEARAAGVSEEESKATNARLLAQSRQLEKVVNKFS